MCRLKVLSPAGHTRKWTKITEKRGTFRRTEAAVFLNNQLSELRWGLPKAIDTSSRLKLAYNV
jgi:hypothetical protein